MATREQQNSQRRIVFKNRHEHIERKVQKKETFLKSFRKWKIQRTNLDLHLRFICDQESRERGLDPFSICPEDCWNMTFEYLTESADFLACMKTCRQFESVLTERRKKFLFKEVFIFLADKLSFEDILNCRRVCTSWTFGVEKALESAYVPTSTDTMAKTPPLRSPIETFVLDCPYAFKIELSNPQEVATCERRRNELKSHPRNPFVGKRIYINVQLSTPHERDPAASMVRKILSDFGPHLFHVELDIHSLLFHPRQYWDLICHTLTVCKSLKALHLVAWSATNEFENLTDNELYFRIEDLPCCPNFEYLDMPTLRRTELAIQDTLIRKYYSQLKILSVGVWKVGLYQHLRWSNLTCLEVSHGLMMNDWENSETMSALRQRELYLACTASEFRKLMPFINRFPALHTCTLTFLAGLHGLGDNRFLTTNQISDLRYSETITCLNLFLNVRDGSNPSFDFLIFFPYVKRLIIETTERHVQRPIRCFLRGERPNDFVQLARYIREQIFIGNDDDNVEPIYRSNIWQILTRLQVLAITRNVNIRGVRQVRKMFTREAYEASLN